MVRLDFLFDIKKDYRKPTIEGVTIKNRRNNIGYIEWYTVLIESIYQYEEIKDLLYSFLVASEKMRLNAPNKILTESRIKNDYNDNYKKYLDENYTYDVKLEN